MPTGVTLYKTYTINLLAMMKQRVMWWTELDSNQENLNRISFNNFWQGLAGRKKYLWWGKWQVKKDSETGVS